MKDLSNSFYNTTHEVGAELKKYREKAATQEQKILGAIQGVGYGYWTPSLVWETVFHGTNVPLTSVRRAMTNLSNKGHLIKSDKKIKGPYGRREHAWVLPGHYTADEQMDMF